MLQNTVFITESKEGIVVSSSHADTSFSFHWNNNKKKQSELQKVMSIIRIQQVYAMFCKFKNVWNRVIWSMLGFTTKDLTNVSTCSAKIDQSQNTCAKIPIELCVMSSALIIRSKTDNCRHVGVQISSFYGDFGEWREGYLLPTLAWKITYRCFDWMLQSSSGWKL